MPSFRPALPTLALATAAAPAAKGPKPGMNDRGEVIDPTKIESGSGQTVKGINDWEGEIVSRPVAGSKFSQLKIGMSMKQVTDLTGPPTDQGAYITGKAWIPFNFKGKDVARIVALYRGKGRIIFSQESVYSSVWRVLELQPNPNETGYP